MAIDRIAADPSVHPTFFNVGRASHDADAHAVGRDRTRPTSACRADHHCHRAARHDHHRHDHHHHHHVDRLVAVDHLHALRDARRLHPFDLPHAPRMQGDAAAPAEPSPIDREPGYLRPLPTRADVPSPPVIEVRELRVVYTAVRGPTGAFIDLFA